MLKPTIYRAKPRERFEIVLWRGDVQFKDVLEFVMDNGAEYENPTDVQSDQSGDVYSFAVNVVREDEAEKVVISRGDAILRHPTYDSRDFQVMSIKNFYRIFDHHSAEDQS
jgi:hypothetical protein